MISGCLFITALLIYAYLYFKNFGGRLFECLLFGLIFFFGINSIYFFATSFFNLKLNISVLLVLNLCYGLLISFIINLNKTGFKIKNSEYHESTIIIVALLLSFVFISNVRSFNNGLRIPIPSFVEDASQHFHITLDMFLNTKHLNEFYPLAFHGNAWLFIEIATQIFGNYDDLVFITNIFSLYIWLILFLTLSLISMIVFNLVKNNQNRGLYYTVIVPLTTLIFGSMISLYFLKHGFLSNWLNQLFSLAIIYLMTSRKFKSVYFLIPLSCGFFFSYSFFGPVLCIFYGYLYFFEKEKKYFSLFVISLLLSAIFMFQIFNSSISMIGLASSSGGFPTYPTVAILFFTLFSIYYLANNKKRLNALKYLSYIGLSFIFYCFGLIAVQVYIRGGISYSFHKVFASAILVYCILAIAGFIVFLKPFFKNYINKTPVLIFNRFMVLIFICLTFYKYVGIVNPPLVDIFYGYGNFFSNSSEKYNSVIYALENYSNFENVIYIEDDYQSTRWATLSYLPTKFNVIYDENSVTNFKNYKYYVSVLERSESSILVINPIKILETDCDSEPLIKLATQSAQIYIYPPFDIDLFRRNCNVINNGNKNKQIL